ncbi:hypothetical protein D3C75_1158310 [compost metagenome]
MHQALFESADFLVGQRVVHRDGDTLCDLLQHPQIGGVEVVRLALRQLQYAQGLVAKHQRQEAQRLDLILPEIEQLAFISRQTIGMLQIEQQHFPTLHHLFG